MTADSRVLTGILGNTGWLLAEKALRMILGLFVGGWVARYLGPEQFGLFNYALALVALFAILANAGLDSVVVRDVVCDPAGRDTVLGSAFLLKLAGGLLAVLGATAAGLLFDAGDDRVHWLVVLMALALLAQAFDTIDLYFQSKLQARYAVFARNVAFVLLAAVKIALILSEAPLIAFAWAVFAESMLSALGLVAAYRLASNRITAWRGSIARMRGLLRQCWPLMLSGLMVAVYTRIDQVMLGTMAGTESVGIYSAGTLLSELWYVVPVAIVVSAAPVLTRARAADPALYRHQLILLFRWLGTFCGAIALPVSLFSEPLVALVFGDAYRASGAVLAVHVWATLFVALGVISSQYLLLEDLNRVSLQRTLAGAAVNILLNMIWIPMYGPVGAAWATLVSYAVASLSLFHNRKSRECLLLMLQALRPSAGRAA